MRPSHRSPCLLHSMCSTHTPCVLHIYKTHMCRIHIDMPFPHYTVVLATRGSEWCKRAQQHLRDAHAPYRTHGLDGHTLQGISMGTRCRAYSISYTCPYSIFILHTHISILDTHISIVDTHISIVDTHISIVDTHISILDTHISILDIHSTQTHTYSMCICVTHTHLRYAFYTHIFYVHTHSIRILHRPRMD